MGIENFIKEALHKPNDYIAYHVGRELAELHPGKTILEGETGYFDLEAFVRAEKCSVVHESSIFNHIKTYWDGPGRAETIGGEFMAQRALARSTSGRCACHLYATLLPLTAPLDCG